MASETVHELVQGAVHTWAHAKSLEALQKAPTEKRRALPSALLPQLISEIAEISAELMVELLGSESFRNFENRPEPGQSNGARIQGLPWRSVKIAEVPKRVQPAPHPSSLKILAIRPKRRTESSSSSVEPSPSPRPRTSDLDCEPKAP